MIPALLLRNPMLTLRFGLYAIAAFTIGALLWRVHYLAERSDAQAIELLQYETSFNEVVRLSALRETVITENLTRSLNDSQDLLNRIVTIESTEDENAYPVAPVLRNAIDSLYDEDSP